MAGLMTKTRSSGRSIGTVGLALRELKENAPELLATLESRFDPQLWLDLIAANGTVFELFKALENSSTAFARRLIADNDWPHIDVTRRSIEEAAAAIITLFNDRLMAREQERAQQA